MANLTPRRRLGLSAVCALASPFLRHVRFALQGQDELLAGFAAMFVGDLAGTLIVLCTTKLLPALVPRRGAWAQPLIAR